LTEESVHSNEISSDEFSNGNKKLLDYLDRFEQILYFVLIGFLLVVLVFSVIELATIIYRSILNDFPYHLESHEILDLFGFFLLIMVGIELLGTIKAFIFEQVFRVEVVILLAIIAIVREVILVERIPSPFQLVGVGVLIICLGVAYYLIRETRKPAKPVDLSTR
jgi:uncharacterized membrane protein (DUF373 family)